MTDEPMAVAEPELVDTRSELTVLVLLRDQLQKLRIAEGNRVAASIKLDDESRADIHRYYADVFEGIEKSITKNVEEEIVSHPVWAWAEEIRGIGPTSLALVVGHIDISKAPTISSLWRYAGYGVALVPCPTCEGNEPAMATCEACGTSGVVGRRERPTKGEKLHYNSRLKTMVWRLIDLQIKLRGPYRDIYDQAKHTYITTRTDWTKGHIEAAARRKAAKIFLSHLWMVWREAEGLPTRAPFIAEHGDGQHDIIGPYEFLTDWKAKQEATVVVERAPV